MAKQYGLIKPDKTKIITRPSIFNSDSDSDNEPEKPTGVSSLKKKERIAQEKAVAEDPTIYQYDELYDDMQSQRKESKLARKDLDKKPKYINKLLETAERRKRENERRIERQVQKEREEEGDMYKDKESFVTTAYRKKLEELKELEEQEKREEYLESIGDVKKQSDLSGFYRHLYAQQVNSDDEKTDKLDEKQLKSDPKQSKNNEKQTNPEPSSSASLKTVDSPTGDKQNTTKKRKYRQRLTSKSATSSSDDETTEKIKLEHLPSNIDADSDFSIDSDSDSEPETKKNKKTDGQVSLGKTNAIEGGETVEKAIKDEVGLDTNETGETNEENKEIKTEKDETLEEIKPEVPKKPKIDIWKKRTVGSVYDDALKRFYERKAARLQSV